MDKVKEIVKILDNKKAQDISVVKVRDITVISDYFIIANGTSSTQVKALAEEVEFKLKQQGVEPARVEGFSSNNWIILDYNDVLVHIFYKETRDFYNLEKLWSDGEIIDISEYLI